MRILVTGSSGHLGEGLVRTLRNGAHEVMGLDRKAGPLTNFVGTIADRNFVRDRVRSIDAIIHTATLHKPHVATHCRQKFIDTNITGTLNLLEEAVVAGVKSFIFTSTTSAFGRALTPPPGAPAAWITEEVQPAPKNIYGVTKVAAENLCELFHHRQGLACVVLRTSRFFPEVDDDSSVRRTYEDLNVKANEYLYRRADLQDVVDAHLLALERATSIGFGRYIISATTPFQPNDLAELRVNAPRVVERRIPQYAAEYARRDWKMFPGIERVYVNERARKELGWQLKYDFRKIIDLLSAGNDLFSPLARVVGSKGYHDCKFADGPYPVS
ncbi:NAD(P)-dependent oxidoreductase [Pleurocapsales cyanobacterium LEGE 06147]|nr:NAD(P)-dependent oxidoreductase [Pleurocapsales cyanobacterium LEGE 06147]